MTIESRRSRPKPYRLSQRSRRRNSQSGSASNQSYDGAEASRNTRPSVRRMRYGPGSSPHMASHIAPTPQTIKAPSQQSDQPSGPRAFAALKNTSFRWFYLSMYGHFIPMNMQMVIKPWLAYALTGSYGWAGWVTLAGAIPMLVLSPIGGLLADRLPKQKIIQIGQLLNGFNSCLLYTSPSPRDGLLSRMPSYA